MVVIFFFFLSFKEKIKRNECLAIALFIVGSGQMSLTGYWCPDTGDSWTCVSVCFSDGLGIQAWAEGWVWWILGLPVSSAGKESTCNMGDLGLIPGLGRSPGEGNGYPLQYSGLENSMDYIVQGITNSWTRLSDLYSHPTRKVGLVPCSPTLGKRGLLLPAVGGTCFSWSWKYRPVFSPENTRRWERCGKHVGWCGPSHFRYPLVKY